jgi:hypothetical protein
MSGALNSVFGGGGIFSAIMNIASIAFPALQVFNTLGNLLTSAIGSAISTAVDTLAKEGGLPKFIANIIKQTIGQTLPGLMNPSDAQADSVIGGKTAGAFKSFEQQLAGDIVDSFKSYKSDAEKNAAAGGKGAAGKSWFVALMMALGEVQNKQAAKVQELAGEVSKVLGNGDDSAGSRQAQFDKMEEFKAEAKLQEVFANITKAVGDSLGQALSTVSRTQ